MNGITNEALTYSKAPLIESVCSNPITNEINGTITIAIPKTCAIVKTVFVIQHLFIKSQVAGDYGDNMEFTY